MRLAYSPSCHCLLEIVQSTEALPETALAPGCSLLDAASERAELRDAADDRGDMDDEKKLRRS